MKISTTYISISRTLIDSYLYAVESYLMKQYGIDQARRDIDPLKWYINSGRAPVQFIGMMTQKKPYMIGRKLHQGGSYDDAVKRVKNYIGFKSSEDR